VVDVGDGTNGDWKKVDFSAENRVSVTLWMMQVLNDVHERRSGDVVTFNTFHLIYRCVCYVYPTRICIMYINICRCTINFRN
jgi:hypothetical protein